jgi:hypothetical protein
MPKPRLSPAERFFTKVDMTGDCWIWTGSTTDYGHGQFYVGQQKFSAYRWLYEQFVGPVPEGLELDHLCRVPACVRPSHLEPVTHRENVLRGVAPTAVNAAKTHCDNGHPFDAENTRLRGNGHRTCRACHRERSREGMRRRRAAARVAASQ